MENIEEQSRKNPLVVVACIVENRESILALKRAKSPYAGLFCLPGGKVEYCEHPVAASLREVKEETGLECKFEKMLGVFSEVLETRNGKKHFVIFVPLLSASSAAFTPSHEGGLKWIAKSKWSEVEKEFIPSDWRIVRDFFLEKNSAMEMREVKMCENIVKGKFCYYLEEYFVP